MKDIKQGENWRKGYMQGVKEERERIKNLIEWKKCNEDDDYDRGWNDCLCELQADFEIS